jgi:Fic family protein
MTMTTSTMTTPTDGASRGPTDPSGAGVIRRIEAEYREMPGLRLTTPQASRLWGLNPGQSERLLSELVDEGFLMRDTRGAYRRRGCPRCS